MDTPGVSTERRGPGADREHRLGVAAGGEGRGVELGKEGKGGKGGKGGEVAHSYLLGPGEINNSKGEEELVQVNNKRVEEFVKMVSWQLRQSSEAADGKDEKLDHVWQAVDLCAR